MLWRPLGVPASTVRSLSVILGQIGFLLVLSDTKSAKAKPRLYI